MNLEPYNLNYQDGLNTYPIIDYIDAKIVEFGGNISIEQIKVNNNSSNNYLSDYIYTSNTHLIINNSNINGEIRIKVKNNNNNPAYSQDYRVRINSDGKLQLYHIFNVLQPTYPSGWYDISDEIIGLKFNSDLQQIEITANGLAVGVIQGQIADIYATLTTFLNALGATNTNLEFTQDLLYDNNVLNTDHWQIMRSRDNFTSLMEDFVEATTAAGVRNRVLENRSFIANSVAGITGAFGLAVQIGLPIAGGIIGALYALQEDRNVYNTASNISNVNFEITPEQRRRLVNSNLVTSISNVDFLAYNLSNLNIVQGFINSNILTGQLIPTLKSNKILLGNITTPNAAYQMEMTGDLNLNMLYLNSTSLTSLLNQKQNNMTATQPIFITTANIGLNYDSSLTKVGNNLSVVRTATTPIVITGNDFSLNYDSSLTKITGNLSVVKTASLPLAITGNNWALNYDSTLTLSGNNLSVAAGSASKWTTSGTNIYNNNTGNVGIGTNIPVSKLTIKSTYDVVDSGLCIDASDSGVNNKYNFKIYPYVVGAGAVGYKFRIVNNTSTTTDVLILDHSGNIGIGVNPSSSLHIVKSLTAANPDAGPVHLYLYNPTNSANNNCIISTRIAGTSAGKALLSYDVNGSHGWACYVPANNNSYRINNNWSGAGTDILTCLNNGNVGINNNAPGYKLDVNGSLNSTSLYIATRIIQDHLFNNTGRTHTTYTDFNTPSDFGCHFIQGSTNGPGFNSQYYSMSLGLGSEYTNYKVQIAIPRNLSSPYLCLRYLEAGSWGGWNRISAGLADNASSSTFSIRSPNEGTNAILYLGTPANSSAPSKCAIIAQGLSSWSRSKLHFCLNGTADNSSTFQAGLSDGSFTFDYDGNMGLMNQSVPNIGGGEYALHLGNSAITTTAGNLVIHKKNNSGGTRLYRIGYDAYFWSSFGDYGNNNTLGTWLYQFSFPYSCPTNSCYINGSGGLVILGTLTQGSDQRIKTDIKTIENALWKVQQLRGVEYTHIIEQTRNIGLIAQEVEHIIPEVVSLGERNDIKSVSYGNLVALLIEGMKELKVINDRQQEALALAESKINNLNNRCSAIEKKILNYYRYDNK